MTKQDKHLIQIRQYASKMLKVNNKDFAIYGIHYDSENHVVDTFDKISYWTTDEYKQIVANTESQYAQRGKSATIISLEK